MAWDYEFAKEIKNQGRSTSNPGILEGTVVKVSPLTISLYAGEIMAPPLPLESVFCAQGLYRDKDDHHLHLDPWKVGDRAVCCRMGKTLVILGRLVDPAKQIETR